MFSKFRELYVLNSKNSLCLLFRYPRSVVYRETWTENCTSNTDKVVTDFLPAFHPSLHNTTNITSTWNSYFRTDSLCSIDFSDIPALQQFLSAAYTYSFTETESNGHQNSDCTLQSVNNCTFKISKIQSVFYRFKISNTTCILQFSFSQPL